MLAAGATAVAGGIMKLAGDGMAIDKALPRLYYPGTLTRFVTLPASDAFAPSPTRPDTIGVSLFTGIGQEEQRAATLAKEMANGPFAGWDVSYSAFALQGIDTRQTSDAYLRVQGIYDQIHEVTNSMGLLVRANIHAMHVMDYVNKYGALPPHLPAAQGAVKTLTIVSGPTRGIEDVHHADMIEGIFSRFQPQASMSGKFIMKALDKSVNNYEPGSDFKAVLESAAGETFDQLSPMLWLSQIYQVLNTNLVDLAQRELLRGWIGSWTKVLYVKSDNDQVVMAAEACDAARVVAETLGAGFEVLNMPGTGHANIPALCKNPQYRTWIGERILSA
jgi:hypothetical protein